MKQVLSYIEVSDGYIPTRPAPVIARTRADPDDCWDVIVIDAHSVEHIFLTGVSEEEAAACAHTLTVAVLSLKPLNIITPQLLSDILGTYARVGDEQ